MKTYSYGTRRKLASSVVVSVPGLPGRYYDGFSLVIDSASSLNIRQTIHAKYSNNHSKNDQKETLRQARQNLPWVRNDDTLLPEIKANRGQICLSLPRRRGRGYSKNPRICSDPMEEACLHSSVTPRRKVFKGMCIRILVTVISAGSAWGCGMREKLRMAKQHDREKGEIGSLLGSGGV